MQRLVLVRSRSTIEAQSAVLVNALVEHQGFQEIDLESLADDGEAWGRVLGEILTSEQCVCI
jgi:hypothetical protein